MDLLQLRHDVRSAVEDTVTRMGYDLVAVEWTGQRVLRLSIDKPGGIASEDCVAVSHRVSPLLDAADPVPGAYTLEVSSPGIDRPVERVDDFRRFRGYRAKIRLAPGPARRRYTGTLRGVDGDEVLIEVDGTVYRLFLDTIEHCHLVLDLDQYQQLATGLPPVEERAEEMTDDQ